MRLSWALAGVVLAFGLTPAYADAPAPLASHRAGYEISLGASNSEQPVNADAPVSASGLIAYEFRGSACEGYASNFRQLTELQRSEGGPVASDVSDWAGRTQALSPEWTPASSTCCMTAAT